MFDQIGISIISKTMAEPLDMAKRTIHPSQKDTAAIATDESRVEVEGYGFVNEFWELPGGLYTL